ncbi:YciI family protein [Flavobacterium sp. J27]|uniref:YciI family protein n=1 Tax=Flavobacterium sp. J27 TaxID=2060419 RepID=UPI0010316D16|nr:YciI family protein [Flavobacterium sp. J27]
MLQKYLLFGLLFMSFFTNAQETNPNYDATLAKKLNADDYGMKSYVFVVLKTGTNTSSDKEFIASCFKSHMENIHKMVKENKLIVAGPMNKNDNNIRGIFILNVTSFEEANALLQRDKAIKENILAVELYNWYGSAALSEYLEVSDKIWKIKP